MKGCLAQHGILGRLLLSGVCGLCFSSLRADFLPNVWTPLRELSVVRDALRDGFWKVADDHAAKAELDVTNSVERAEVRLARLEALGRAGNASGVADLISSWPAEESQADAFRWWSAWAAAELGRQEEVSQILARPFVDPVYAALALRLRARLAVRQGREKEACKCFADAANILASDVNARSANALEWARFCYDKGDVTGALNILQVQKARACSGGMALEVVSFEADCYAKLGQFEQARALRKSLLDKELPVPLRRHVVLTLALEDLKTPAAQAKAMETIHQLIRENPDDFECRSAWITLANALLSSGQADKAAREFQLYLEAYPTLDPVPALEGRAWALLEGSHAAEAAVAFMHVAEVSTNVEVRLRCQMKRGDALMMEKRFADAANVFLDVAKSCTGTRGDTARFRAADSFERLGDRKQATALYEGLKSSAQKDLAQEASLRLAGFAVQEEKNVEALELYESLLKCRDLDNVRLARAYAGRGRVRYQMLHFTEAADDFRQAGKRLPNRTDEMRFFAALCLYGEGRDLEARTQVTNLLQVTTNQFLKADLALWIAKYDYNRGDWQRAQKAFVAAIPFLKQPSVKADAWLLAGRAAGAGGDFSESVRLLSQAIGLLPDGDVRKDEAYLAQGEALMELARFDEAVYVLERVTHDGCFSVRAVLLKADALFALGAADDARYEAALDAYKQVLSGDLSASARLSVNFKYARTLEKLRRFDEAVDRYYTHVVLAYVDLRKKNIRLESTADVFFVRAGFVLADHLERRGDGRAVKGVLRLMAVSGTQGANEAKRRLEELKAKGIR